WRTDAYYRATAPEGWGVPGLRELWSDAPRKTQAIDGTRRVLLLSDWGGEMGSNKGANCADRE
ncbi:MAG: hypothetical protein ACREAC_05645, partial [Blastocatellia bacterium]